MIEGLKPYPQYKDSGDPFIGEIPSGWSSFPISQVARLKTVTNQTNRELLSVYLNRGVVKFSEVSEKRTNVTSDDLSKYQAVDPGDLVLNNQQAWRGSVGVSNYRGIVSPAYLVLTLSSNYDSKYANILFRDRSLVAQYLVCSKGVGTIQRNLYWPHLKRVSTIIPPPDEQAAIVRFLDYANGKIERAIRAKRKLIGLLNEQKQAIIHRAVTRGLDPNVKLKSSGIPWLGDVPEHWEVRRLKQIAKMQSGENITSLEINEVGEYPVYGGNGLRGYTKRYTHEGHYALIGRQGALCGNVNFATGRFWASEHAVIPTLCKEVSLLWFGALIQTMNLRQYSQSAAQPGLSVEMIGRLGIPLPHLSEQKQIEEQICNNTDLLMKTLSRTEREIDLLREYRTTLTAEVVTGKLDVREAARRLPDQADEALPPDDSMDELIEDEIDQEDDA